MTKWVALGDRAIRFPRPASTSPRAIVREARAWPGVIDVVVARDDVAIYFEAVVASHDDVAIYFDAVVASHDAALYFDDSRARDFASQNAAAFHSDDSRARDVASQNDPAFHSDDSRARDVAASSNPRFELARLDVLATLVDDSEPAREVELHATYDGPDLDDVVHAAGMSIDQIVELHRQTTYVVETMGFAPGFAYLTGLDSRLHVPRRATPRTRVPAGSLAIAAGYTAVYPFDSPGGWNLIGRVDERMFDGDGALLRLGDRVRFV